MSSRGPFWNGLDLARKETPELMFQDKRALECARLLAAECDSAEPLGGLYGEGLTLALLGALFQQRTYHEASGLSASQLRLVLDFMHEHLDAPLSLSQLAHLVGKASTRVSPHRYHLNTRIGKAQALLFTEGKRLSELALTTGFADQSHFSRVFKRAIGTTPSAWLKDRRS